MKLSLSQLGVQLSIHIAEMVKVLRSKTPVFPLCERLMDCGVQAGLCLRGFEAAAPSAQKESAMQAAAFASEADYLLEMATEAGYLFDAQTASIRADCKELEQAAKAVNHRINRRNRV